MRVALLERMEARKYGDDIAARLLAFSLRSLEVIEALPRNRQGWHVGDQLFRSATAGGAQYEEARGAESRADFVHKLSVGAKEVREARYWLSLISKAAWVPDLEPLIDEARQLAAILNASASTAKNRKPKTDK